jgi:nucleoside-diphosphate-sugar epimerase
MRILLIGGTGFIGSFLAPELQRLGADVAVLTRGRSGDPSAGGLTRIIGDRKRLRESESAVRAFAPDVVVDLVLSSGTQAQELMAVMRGIATRVVALSSMDVYRACGVLHGLEDGPLEPVPLTEQSALRTKLSTYPPAQIAFLQRVFGWLDDDYDKIPVERAILGDSELPGTVLRLPMVYGPGDPLHRFWPLVKRMDDARPAILMTAPMAAWRSPRGYVENVAAAIARAAMSDAAAGRVYNVGEQPSYSEIEWVQRVAAATDWQGDVVILSPEQMPAHLRVPANYDQHWTVDTTRIRAELGFTERVNSDAAIRRTIAWERANPPAVPLAVIDYDAEDAALATSIGSAGTSTARQDGQD